jgi:putative hemolysin
MNNKKIITIISLVVIVLGILYLTNYKKESLKDSEVQIANPASTFCIESGGTLEIVETPESQMGNCTLPNGTVCEEWALFRGECASENNEVQTGEKLAIFESYQGKTADDQNTIIDILGDMKYQITKNDQVLIGSLNTERGWNDDIDATVYILNWDSPIDEQIFFLRKTGVDSIVQLDSERNIIEPKIELIKQ